MLEVGTAVLAACLCIAAVGIIVITMASRRRRSSDYPPGPSGLPFIGHLHIFLFNKNPVRALSERYSAEYPNIFTVWKGRTPVVYFNSYKAIHEAFIEKAECVNSRCTNPGLTFNGVSALMGEPHSTQLKLREHVDAVFGENHCLDKLKIEEVISDEAKFYMEELHKNRGIPFDAKSQLRETVVNVITRVVFGDRLEYGSQQIEDVQYTGFMLVNSIAHKIPCIKSLPSKKLNYRGRLQSFIRGEKYARESFKIHKERLGESEPSDFIDHYLLNMKEQEGNKDSVCTTDQLFSLITQLYLGGSETTSDGLSWAFLFMLLNPAKQRKVQAEIDLILGTNSPKRADQASMPYTRAVIAEVLRQSIATESVPYMTVQDVKICGQKIPIGTTVGGMIWSMHNDNEVFPHPHTFLPERHVDVFGHYIEPDRAHMPFGIGGRSCPGQTLARTQLFYLFVCVLQKYDICAVDGEEYSTRGESGPLTCRPKPYKLLLNERTLHPSTEQDIILSA